MRTMYLKALNLKEQHKWEEFLSYMTQIYVALDEFIPEGLAEIARNDLEENKKIRIATIELINLQNYLKKNGKW